LATADFGLSTERIMQLNTQEIDALRRGEKLEVEVPEVGGRCIVVRSEDWLRLAGILGDGLPMTVVSELIDQALEIDDAADPWLASYQSCRP
jgi:hypothetical protein